MSYDKITFVALPRAGLGHAWNEGVVSITARAASENRYTTIAET